MLLFAALALSVAGALFSSLLSGYPRSWIDKLRPPSRAAAPPEVLASTLVQRLEKTSLAALSLEEVELHARALARAAHGPKAAAFAARAFPPDGDLLALLALDRDVDDFAEAAQERGPAGVFYGQAALLAVQLRPLRSRYERLFRCVYEVLALRDRPLSSAARPRRPGSPAPGEIWRPVFSQLPYSHPYALDLFFKRVEKKQQVQVGPKIRSLSPGLVVAAASDWEGGAGAARWEKGGLSPGAGNGIVIYDPFERRYYSYFHLSSVQQKPGAVVEAGEVLGRGGNTGMNARRPDHGGHLHLEIFDAEKNEALDAYAIIAELSFK